MDDNYKQLTLLIITVIVPIYLLFSKKERLLLGWVCITLFVQIFDTSIYTNLPAGRIVGLIFLPQSISLVKSWLKILPVKIWMINYMYLLVLAVIFGFLIPWPDSTMARPLSLTAPGRSIIYSIRLLSDLSLALFIAGQLRRPGTLLYAARCMVVGTTSTALAGMIHLISNADLFNIITGLGGQVLNIERARGLSLEPRAMGMACAYGIMILLLGRSRISRYWILLIFVNLIALLISYSASSFVLLMFGVITASIFFSNRERAIVVMISLLIVMSILVASIYAPSQVEYAITTLQFRLDPEYKLSGIPTGNFGQEIAYRLDVFDSSALLFLLDQPLYALIGTGPGLVSLPASYYVPPGLYSLIWTPEVGINSPPSHGLLLEISNSGLIGISLWLLLVVYCWRSLRFAVVRIKDRQARADWELASSLFLIGSIFYLIQVSSSPVWSVFLAIGWVSSRAVSEYKARRSATIHGNDKFRYIQSAA